MDRWVGKVAFITGASSGIGASTVKALAEKGVIVVAVARREDRLKELAKNTKGTIHPVKCDLTKEEEILKAFDWVEKTLGGVDILINNAGLVSPDFLNNGTTEGWSRILNTNLLGLSICSREALKTMRKRGDDGHIIHINSIAGHYVPLFANAPAGMYAASKHAVTSLTESLRIELMTMQSRIRVTSISPGKVITEFTNQFVPEFAAKFVPAIEGTPGCLQPEDIADSILYVLGTKPHIQVHELIIQPLGQKYW